MNNQYKDYQSFFIEVGDIDLESAADFESFTIEEMYQHFKARIWDEIKDEVKYIAYKEANNIED